jgi:CHRD domain
MAPGGLRLHKPVHVDPRPMEEKMNVATFQRVLVPFAIALSLAGAGVAQADPASFKAELTGAQSVPPVDTTGAGTAELTYDPATRVVTWNIAYSGLSSPATMAHFHGPAKTGQNAPPVIWLSKQGSPPANPITGSATLTPEQAKQFSDGEWYINVHTQAHPAGEIRGQVTPPKS